MNGTHHYAFQIIFKLDGYAFSFEYFPRAKQVTEQRTVTAPILKPSIPSLTANNNIKISNPSFLESLKNGS